MPDPDTSSDQPTVAPHAANVPAYGTGHLANVMTAMRQLRHPTHIGPYQILGLIGEGGMGSVYKAEQREPIRRVVALKIIKLGMDTREVIARFESERQALAVMNHPHVAKVLDAGTTETGRPYFVMEYVAGEPITTYADRAKLTIRQRLELFVQACEAVQHAHQKAIIHRDLKPSNILVTEQDDKPSVKVIDFGVAKALSQRLTERTLFTETGQFVGTPEYMAPEQADGHSQMDIDTRSDVYSLGVVLYELLSGALPFDPTTLRSAGYHEIQRIIREVDPPRPSTRLSGLGKTATEVARLRQTPLDSLSRQLKRELEWIPLKAMRKDRAERYATATALADDIQNYLSDRPLRAGPETAGYRARKFLRRNKRVVAASAAMLLLLIAGIAATSWQAIRATRAERQALLDKREAEAQRSRAEIASANERAINRFLTEDLLALAAPEFSRGRETTVRDALDRAAEAVGRRFGSRPLIQAAVRNMLAETYESLGLPTVGMPHAQAAMQIRLRQHGPDHPATLESMLAVGRLLAAQKKYEESELLLRDAYQRAQRALGPEQDLTLQVLSELAVAIRRQRRFADAEPLYRAAVQINRRLYGVQSPEYANALNGLGVLLSEADRDDEAEPLLRQSLELRRRQGDDDVHYLTSLSNFAKLLQRRGKLDQAERAMREALAGRRRVLKDDHPQTMMAMNDLSWTLAERGQLDEAGQLAREALSRRRRVLGDDDRDTLQSTNALGRILTLRGEYAEAEKVLKETVEKRRRVLGERHAHTLGSMAHLARVYELEQRFAQAEPLLAHVCQPELRPILGTEDAAAVLLRYGQCLAQLGKWEQAETPLLEAINLLGAGAANQQSGEPMRRALAGLAEVYRQTNRPEDARRARERLEAMDATAPTTEPATAPAS